MKKTVTGILVAAIIVVILIVMFKFGFGIGFGTGAGDGSDTAATSETQQEEDQAVKEAEGTVLKVTVAGNEYIFDNEKITIDALMEKLSENKAATVEVTDDNASKNAYDGLIDQLNEQGIDYSEQ